jgi:hypothetical protein
MTARWTLKPSRFSMRSSMPCCSRERDHLLGFGELLGRLVGEVHHAAVADEERALDGTLNQYSATRT